MDITNDEAIQETDTPLFGTEPTTAQKVVPAGGASSAPQDDLLTNPTVLLAIERAKTETYEKALANRVEATPTTRREVDYSPQATMQRPPDTWQDMLTTEQRQQYAQALISNPEGAAQFAATAAAQHQNWVMQYQAAPLIQSNARLIVESFKNRMRGRDHKYADQIEPLFDAEMARTPDLRALVTMGDRGEQELLMRWNSAKASVQDKIMANPPKVEPRLLASGSQSSTPTLATNAVEADPLLAAMNARYKFSPEQIKALQETR